MSDGYDPFFHQAELLRTKHYKECEVVWGVYQMWEVRSPCYRFFGFRNHGKKGDGSKCLRELCDLADRYAVRINLDTNRRKLQSYYESHGFSLMKKERHGREIHYNMQR